MNSTAAQELIRLEEAWNLAMIQNHAEAIGPFMADDWTIIGPDGTQSDKPTFLGLVKSGALTHDVMECDAHLRRHGRAHGTRSLWRQISGPRLPFDGTSL